MVNNEIKMRNSDCDTFDKKQIALAIRNSTLGDELGCSLRIENIIDSCDNCSLRFICYGINKIKEEYLKDTSIVIKKFDF